MFVHHARLLGGSPRFELKVKLTLFLLQMNPTMHHFYRPLPPPNRRCVHHRLRQKPRRPTRERNCSPNRRKARKQRTQGDCMDSGLGTVADGLKSIEAAITTAATAPSTPPDLLNALALQTEAINRQSTAIQEL